MNRRPMQGLYLPREDLIGWAVTLMGERYTHENPGPIGPFEVELDAIGCLAGGSIELLRPLRLPSAFSTQVFIELLSKQHGWVPVARGCVPPVKSGGLHKYSLELMPLEDRHLDGYYDGSVVYDTLGLGPAEWNKTNRQVVEERLRAFPDASIGTDWNGQVILARPTDGEPAQVSRGRFYDWRDTGEVVLPYATESRWDGGRGWQKGEYRGIARPECAPRRAVDAEAVGFFERIEPSGPRVVHRREVVATLGADNSLSLETRDIPEGHRTVTAAGYAHVTVLDMHDWWLRSALPGQDRSQIEDLEKELGLQQEAYKLALDTLGPEHEVVQQAADRVSTTGRQLQLAQIGTEQQSDYEPLSAKLNYGFLGKPEPGDNGRPFLPPIVTGLFCWISTQPWDAKVFEPTLEEPDLVAPTRSEHSLFVLRADLADLEGTTASRPWTPGELTIPEQYFRQNMLPTLAKQMDALWGQSFDPDLPPEGEGPPSKDWDTRWYLHIAAWWEAASVEVVTPPGGGNPGDHHN